MAKNNKIDSTQLLESQQLKSDIVVQAAKSR